MAALSHAARRAGSMPSLALAAMLALAQPGMSRPSAAQTGGPPAPSAPDRSAGSASAPVTTAPGVERWRPLIAEASRRFGIPESWIAAVMHAESAGMTHLGGRPITSRAGAMGLMQVMPDTYAAMRRAYGLGPDPYDPRDNIMAGAAYLREMHGRFGYPGLFAAYNAGPARYAEHLATGRPLPGETRAYIAQLAAAPTDPSMPPTVLSGTRLFFPTTAPGAGADVPASGGLFAPINAPSGPER